MKEHRARQAQEKEDLLKAKENPGTISKKKKKKDQRKKPKQKQQKWD